jgi:ribosomal protein S18 acetylase RimI-like enzyme
MDLDVTRAVPGDAGELMTLQRAAYLSEARLNEDYEMPPLLETAAQVRGAIERERVLKALAGTRIVGAVRARVADGTGYIGRLVVAPDLQGQGIGTRLMNAAEADLDGLVGRFELFTGPRSAPNIRFYERLGYRRIRTPPGAEPLVFLEKRLSSA